MIKLEHVKKDYQAKGIITNALRDISLTINEGELIAIMGTSGSGKSTLLHIIGGMDTITSGDYWFDNEKISSFSLKQLQLHRKKYFSFVFQNFALMSMYTVYENIEIPLLARKEKNRKPKIMAALEQLGIYELSNKYPNQLSGGQQQRTAIARALVAETPFFLADEPTGSLDQKTGMDIMKCFQQIHKKGKTVIVVTHDYNIANQCDRIVHIEDGVIAE